MYMDESIFSMLQHSLTYMLKIMFVSQLNVTRRMLVSFDFRGKLTSVEELQNWLANQNNKWYSISYTVRDEEVSVILQPIEKVW